MGRFYRTSGANPLDYMYRLNTPLMEKVITANDQYITDNLKQLQGLNTAVGSIPYLEPDSDRVHNIMNNYGSRIDDITKSIKNDPAKWKNSLGDISNLSTQLHTDFTTGEISKIAYNYSKYKQTSDYIDKQLDQYNKNGKGISADRARAYKQYFLDQFVKANPKGTAYDPNTGSYNAINTFDPMGNMDIKKVLSDGIDKMKASGEEIKQDSQTGMYLRKTTRGWEAVSPDRILSAMRGNMSPELMNYIRQDSQIGILNGMYDRNPDGSLGDFIDPYSYTPNPPTSNELGAIKQKQDQINKLRKTNPEAANAMQTQLDDFQSKLTDRADFKWNNNSALAKMMQGVIAENAWSKNKAYDELRPDSVKTTIYTQGQINTRDQLNRASREALAKDREAGVQKRFDDRLTFDKYKWDNPHATGTGKSTTTPKPKDKDKATADLPQESQVSKIGTNSFENWNTTSRDGVTTVPVLSTEGLTGDIENFKKKITDYTSRINTLDSTMKSVLGNRTVADLSPAETVAYNKMLVESDQLKKELPVTQSELNARRKWYEQSMAAALSNDPAALSTTGGSVSALTPDEIELYNKYANDRSGYKKLQETKNLAQSDGYLFQEANSGAYSNKFSEWLGSFGANSNDPSRESRKEYTKYLNVKQKVDDRRDNFLANIRKDYITTDGVSLGKEDNDIISKMIFSQTQGLKMFDKIGKPTDKIVLDDKGVSWFNPKGDNHNLSFTDNELLTYMAHNHVVPKIEQIGNTTGIGTGNAVAKVTFDDPNGEIPKTPFYIELTPELQKQIGTRISINKNPDVAKIGKDLLDNEANDLRRQLIAPSMQSTVGQTNKFEPITSTMLIGTGTQKIPVTVTRFTSSDGTHISLQARDSTGNLVPFVVPKPDSIPQTGLPGWYNGPEDFIKQWTDFRARTANNK